jgi:hypothetical protein
MGILMNFRSIIVVLLIASSALSAMQQEEGPSEYYLQLPQDIQKLIVNIVARSANIEDAINTITALTLTNKSFNKIVNQRNVKQFIIDRLIDHTIAQMKYPSTSELEKALNELSQKNAYIRSMARDEILDDHIMNRVIEFDLEVHIKAGWSKGMNPALIAFEVGPIGFQWLSRKIKQDPRIKKLAEEQLWLAADMWHELPPRMLRMIEFTLKAGVNPNTKGHRFSSTTVYSALFEAFVAYRFMKLKENEKPEVLELFLNAGADINMPYEEGKPSTILDFAMQWNLSPLLIKYLREKGAKTAAELGK